MSLRSIQKDIIVRTLTREARALLGRERPLIVGITGSVGKTTAKDAIKEVMTLKGEVRASKKSENSEIGIPLTILGLENAWESPLGWGKNLLRGAALALGVSHRKRPDVLVLEIGADRPGDIQSATRWITPSIAVLTRLPDTPVHVANFPGGVEEVRKEKSALARALPLDGTLVGNGDDPAIVDLGRSIGRTFVRYGFGEGCDVRAGAPSVRWEGSGADRRPVGMCATISMRGEEGTLCLDGVLGVQPIYAFLAALGVAGAVGIPLPPAVAALEAYEPPRGRMRLHEGRHGSTLIDDSYNSSPIAARAALEALRGLDVPGRRIAVLGDMLELGDHEREAHREIGRLAGMFLDLLVLVGKRAVEIGTGAREAGMNEAHIHAFATSEEAGAWLSSRLERGDGVLFKGSQGAGVNRIRMEHAVKLCLTDPGMAAELLVRQEPQWEHH
jgi:UDP-N-acetylmuramoyl-tripeptide--D-alanyl-D-alanine ligase